MSSGFARVKRLASSAAVAGFSSAASSCSTTRTRSASGFGHAMLAAFEGRERYFGATFDVAAEELGVVDHGWHSL